MAKLPKFKGISPVTIEADILKGAFGRDVDKEVHKRYDFPVIDKVRYNPKTKQVEGSNIPYVIAVNEVIIPEGLRTATVDDIKLIRQINLLNLKGFYEDIACVVRALEGNNGYFAKILMEGNKQKLPATINLSDLGLIKDDKSDYGLALKLRENAQLIPGDLSEYKGSSALSRLYLSRDLGLGSIDDYLGYSGSGGRVVIVGGKATQKF